jgi:hypothetical protein
LDGIAGNMTQIYPLITLMITSLRSLTTDESYVDDEISAWTTLFEAIGIMLLWINLFMYLGVFDTTNYLTRMIREVLTKIWVFFLIYMIFHFAFAEAFFYISSSSDTDYQFVSSYIYAVIYSFTTALGDYDYEAFMVDDN